MNKYFCYHKHSSDSLLDSCTSYQDYIDYEVNLGHTATAFTEHGKPMCWVKKKQYCDAKGIKYIHGVECYLTKSLDEKVRDNYHTVLLAKNLDGVKEINAMISLSTDERHSYYVNRLSFQEFLDLSSNVIKISACLASPLRKLDHSHKMYERLAEYYDYYEIQPHNCPEQKEYNLYLYELSKKYNKKLIAATDTHSLSNYKSECRDILMLCKGQRYENEDSFNLIYMTYDELVEGFRVQNALPEEVYMQAIEETNLLADSIEPFELDTSLKYPILYGTVEEDNRKFLETISTNFDNKIQRKIIPVEQQEQFRQAIQEEVRVFNKLQMGGFMLSMSELITYCKDNDMPIGFGRGSVCGSAVAYITNITDVNPITWGTVFSRFCNEDRVEVGDIDVDVVSSDRPKIFEYIINRFGKKKTARVASFGTLADKATIDCICKALDIKWHDSHSGESPYSLKAAKQIKILYEKNPDTAREKYKDVFYFFDGLVGTKISQSVHPAGMVISPIPLASNYGVFHKDGDICLMIDMDECHDVGLVKYDFLILKTLGVISGVCKMIGASYPTADQIDWYDENVWNDLSRNSSTIFQFETEYASKLLRQFKPKSIFDMSLVTASLRPSGASYRDSLMNRKKHSNPSVLIDKLLEKDYGYLVYQESIIAFLQQICGLSGSEADTVRRGIAKKKMDVLEKWMPKILNGYCEKSDKVRSVAEQEAKEYLKVIEDASSYMFGKNHSIAYCMIGYLCAYYRYYHPLEYITAYLNEAANESDIINGTSLAKEYGIRITPPRFGESAAKYMPHPNTNTISKGIETVKYMNESVSNNLYNFHNATCLLDILDNATNLGLNSRQIEILIKIGYFANFGNMRELLKIVDIYNVLKGGSISSIKSDNFDNVWWHNIALPYVNNVGKNGAVLKSYKVINGRTILEDCVSYIMNMGLNDLDNKIKMAAQKEYLGYIDLTTGKEEDRRKLIIEKVVPLKNKTNGEAWGYAVFTKSMGSGKSARLTVRARLYDLTPIHEMDIVYAESIEKNKAGYWYLTSYEIVV